MHPNSAITGVALGAVSIAVPDGLASFGTKLLTGVAVALVTTLVSELVKRALKK